MIIGIMRNKFIYFSLVLLLTGCNSQNKEKRTIANPLSSSNIAELTIHAFDGKSEKSFLVANMGHAYISILNRQTTPLLVGNYTVAANEELYFGTWGQEVHWGVWYNLEALYLKMDRYAGRVSLTRGINDANDISEISTYIKDHNYWSFAFNCTSFATGLWNEIAGSDKIAFKNYMNPTDLRKSLQEFDSFTVNRALQDSENYETASYFDGEEQYSFALKSEAAL